jgi:hypothetical protein
VGGVRDVAGGFSGAEGAVAAGTSLEDEDLRRGENAVSENVKIVGEYYRSRSGEVVHLAPCPGMGDARFWDYADGKGLREVAAEVNAVQWMRLCRRCWPAGAFGESAEARS